MSNSLKQVGTIAHYFTKINVAVIELDALLKTGDRVAVKGMTTDFEQTVDSMQIEHIEVKEAKKGDSIGLKVKDRVRPGDIVYKVVL